MLAKGEGVVVPPMPGHDHSSLMPFESDAPETHAAANSINVDVIFPVLHGTFGEDGTIQGLLELADIPYVGAGVLGSAAGMDKDVMKRLFRDAGLPIVKHVTVLRSVWREQPKKARKLIEGTLKYPVFVKPANLGSSVGISKVHGPSELAAAMDEAAQFDRKLVIEQGVGGDKAKAREIECSVLGNDNPIASVPGEIVPIKEFYDYDAKYLVEGSRPIIPAELPKSKLKEVQKLAIAAFQAVDCSGLARVDFLMDPRYGQDVRQRDQHHAGVHVDQHVSQAVGGKRAEVSRADRPADPVWTGAPRREEAEPVQPMSRAMRVCVIGMTALLCAMAMAAQQQATVSPGLYSGIVGEWVGQLEYRDYSDNERVFLPTWLTVKHERGRQVGAVCVHLR